MNSNIQNEIDKYRLIGNEISGFPVRVNGDFKITCGEPGVKINIGRNVIFNNFFLNVEKGSSILNIGDDCYVRGNHFIGKNSSITIGARTVFNRHANLTATEEAHILIGEECLFSNISIATTDWHSIIDQHTGQRINPAANIVIEDRVWLGEEVIVLKGIRIGTQSVIGTRALVTKSIPSGSLAVGIPARVVRSGVTWQRDLIPMPPLGIRIQ